MKDRRSAENDRKPWPEWQHAVSGTRPGAKYSEHKVGGDQSEMAGDVEVGNAVAIDVAGDGNEGAIALPPFGGPQK